MRIPTAGLPAIRDPYLATEIEAALAPLEGAALTRAQAAVLAVSLMSFAGDFQSLRRRYLRAIQEAVDPGRKPVTNPRIDRAIVKNEQLAALLDREIEGATREEVAAANAALKHLIDGSRALKILPPKDSLGDRRVVHERSPQVCKVEEEHETSRCGFFKDPTAMTDTFVAIVRASVGL